MKNESPGTGCKSVSRGFYIAVFQSERLQRAVENEVERQHRQDHQGGGNETLVPEAEGRFMALLLAQGEDQNPRCV